MRSTLHPVAPSTPRRSRRAGAAAIAVTAALILAACGTSSSDDAAGSAPASSLLPEAEGSTQYPLELDTWLGSSTLEERPERVAVIGFSSNLDALEAIGVTPVYYGGRDAEKTWAWNDPEYYSGIETLDTPVDDGLNFEGILAAKPDVILSVNAIVEAKDHKKLADIAPVIDLTEDPGNGDRVDWRDVQRQVGEALDLSEAADQAIADADERIAAVAKGHPELAGKTVTIGYDYGPEFGYSYYTVAGGPAEGVMLDLGFEPNPLAEKFVNDDVVSDENQALLEADVLLTIYSDEASRAAREKQALFSALSPVAEGRYESLVFQEDSPTDQLQRSDGTLVENAVWVLRRGASALALPWAAEEIADNWLGGLDLS